jgi:hypothetical protein
MRWMIARNEVSLISLELGLEGMLKRLLKFFMDGVLSRPVDEFNYKYGRIRMVKKKPAVVKSKKKTRIPKEDDPAYNNRAGAQEEDEEELDISDEVEEVGLEKDDEDEDDDF